jgi:hypothetical protein
MALQHPVAQEECKFITQTALRQFDSLWITLFGHGCGFQANSLHALAKPLPLPSLARRTGRGPEGGAGRPRPLPRRTRDHRPWRKVFGALLAIAGAVSVMTGHWATTDDMIADLIAGGLVLAVGIVVLLMWSFQR